MPTIVDLSHVLEDGTVTYPGLPAPVITDHLSREASRERYAPGYEFQIGKGVTAYGEGSDVGLVTTGYMIKTAKLAAEKLRRQGIGVRVDHHPSHLPAPVSRIVRTAPPP